MKKYIMASNEYEALDNYLDSAKMYDSGIRILQTPEHGDYGFDDEEKEVVTLKELIEMCFLDNDWKSLIGYRGFSKSNAKTIQELYQKLEDLETDNDIKDIEIPSLELALSLF